MVHRPSTPASTPARTPGDGAPALPAPAQTGEPGAARDERAGSASSPFAPIPEILEELRRGRMVVLTDDEDRENEGDLVLPAQFVTPEAITFMLSEARGYLCLSLTGRDCDRLDLHPQAGINTSARSTAFTVSIDGHPRHGFTTGVSARERARCIRMAIDPSTTAADFVRPGHINPLRARDGGVLARTGQTEGSVDLCRLAGLHPSAVIIEIMRPDGEMARVPDLVEFCRRHGLKMCSVAQIIQHRLSRESLVRRLEPVRGAPIRTAFGTFTLYLFESAVDALPHAALCAGDVGAPDPSGLTPSIEEPVLVRMHRRSTLGDVFHDLSSLGEQAEGPPEGLRCSADVLHASMRAIAREGRGAVVYLRTETPPDAVPLGPGVLGALEARINRPRRGAWEPDAPAWLDPDRVTGPTTATPPATSPASTPPGRHTAGPLPRAMRDLGVGCQILRNLGVSKLRLLTNHATDLPGLDAFGLSVVERVPIHP